MDELISKVAKQANISGDQAKHAVESVMGFLKDKLPAPVADQINGVLNGKPFDPAALTSALGGHAGNVGDALGDILSSKK